ncbi:hypothetical protein KU43P_34090 [Pseudomonas sp. KU43P]|nr:hypothetical protein KU43P_34090 [Pseudomonas sp. KU43P]
METITRGKWTGHLGMLLAPRELEALLWVAQDLTTKEIARLMEVSPGTVANGIERVIHKLKAKRRMDAVMKAWDQKIISPLALPLPALSPCML